MIERRTVFKVVAAASAAALAAACSGGSNDGTAVPQGGSGDNGGKPVAPVAKLTATPAAGAKDASVREPVVVKVTEGKLTEVKLTNEGGDEIKGEIAPDGLSWTSSEPLGYGKTYNYAAKATGSDQRPAELKGSFATVSPAKTVRATLNPGDDAEVGVAMPISVKFNGAAPKDRVAVEKALKVKTSKDVEGSWAWLSANQVDWRPKEYWPANTTVEVEANLYGVDLGGGVYVKSDVSTKFKIGRNQVVKIHTPDHVMKVYRGGAESASYPCSNGLDSVVDRNTPNGTFIIMSKEPHAVFDNARYGYTNVNKKWACRFSNHGEFIHENQDNAAAIGKTNNSHGCVNLLEADAKAYFDTAMIGDPVEVTGSKLGSPTNSDVKDWFYDWPTWKSLSAAK
ncbi:L,D-transpeptidase family protein [Amycolatopsis rubida]|uniref:L,D-transpeptidase family protein n=1 Tax=Amycolatopsis rubida TaxID=112413 RepID=A0A1I5DND0_9PSEU|nr:MULTISPECIES: Ig-like domain-containing protein [Amycolatopsis]MYW92528.1 L,D-transpeptidase family protein [Amycolatopsis rubida]NEC57514.1 L,D-transpeptidase family protein [Amycolatopsis rubida]OAP20287.1 putative L,D-transpeptidase LppS precursor [Amycolatopsis sp. M39]SFO00744.1 Lipoprotein-anchoring transpeptidase ErfK/SrfK [Amycolatopsis rubida]